MTIARRPLDDDASPGQVDPPALDSPPSPPSVARPSGPRDVPEVPTGVLAIGILLVLVFGLLVVQAYSGRSFLSRLATLLPGARSEQLIDADRPRALYVPGAAVQVGQLGIGSRGQDRAFQAGDLVLLGATRTLVRLEEADRVSEVRAAEGTSLLVTSLGAWDAAAGSLAGLTARYVGGTWVLDAPPLQPVGAPLHVQGAPEEELTDGFRLVPAPAGRIRRLGSPAGPVVRLRPTGRVPSLALETSDPLPTLDNVAVTVQAVVRATEGATLELALHDVVDAAGTAETSRDRRGATSEDEWLTLRVHRRVTFGSPDDRVALGLLEVRNRDWLEVRELGVYLGILP